MYRIVVEDISNPNDSDIQDIILGALEKLPGGLKPNTSFEVAVDLNATTKRIFTFKYTQTNGIKLLKIHDEKDNNMNKLQEQKLRKLIRSLVRETINMGDVDNTVDFVSDTATSSKINKAFEKVEKLKAQLTPFIADFKAGKLSKEEYIAATKKMVDALKVAKMELEKSLQGISSIDEYRKKKK